MRRLYGTGRRNAAMIVRALWSGGSKASMRYSDSDKQNASESGDSHVETLFLHFLPPMITSVLLSSDVTFNSLLDRANEQYLYQHHLHR
jgi:hypothetical protein